MSRIEELEKRLAADPNSRMFVQLAEEYRKAGLLEQAIEVCESGLKKHPQYPSARVALGRTLLEAGSLDRAVAEFETVLKQVPDNILANKFLGETYQKLGRLEDAIKKYRVALTLAPEDTEIGVRIQEVQEELAAGGPAAIASTPPASVPIPGPADDVSATALEEEPEGEATQLIDLPPIPLVEVDEPMVLETRDYIPPSKAVPPAPPSAPVARASAPPPVFTELESQTFLDATVVDRAPPAPAPRPPVGAEPKAPPSPPPPPKVASTTDIETPTMAEIYASQGHFDQALAVYRRIIEREPNETRYRERVEELMMLARASAASTRTRAVEKAGGGSADSFDAQERTMRVLEEWLEAIRRSRGT